MRTTLAYIQRSGTWLNAAPGCGKESFSAASIKDQCRDQHGGDRLNIDFGSVVFEVWEQSGAFTPGDGTALGVGTHTLLGDTAAITDVSLGQSGNNGWTLDTSFTINFDDATPSNNGSIWLRIKSNRNDNIGNAQGNVLIDQLRIPTTEPIAAVPEPLSALLVGAAGGVLLLRRRR